jgi:hypothetical protein
MGDNENTANRGNWPRKVRSYKEIDTCFFCLICVCVCVCVCVCAFSFKSAIALGSRLDDA